MFVPSTRVLRGVYFPSKKEKGLFALSFLPAVLIGIHIVRQATDGGTYPFNFGLLGFLLLFPLAMSEANLRKVTVDDEAISAESPLRLYRQKYRHENLEGARITETGKGPIAEVCLRGRWIVFCSNDAFKARIQTRA